MHTTNIIHIQVPITMMIICTRDLNQHGVSFGQMVSHQKNVMDALRMIIVGGVELYKKYCKREM